MLLFDFKMTGLFCKNEVFKYVDISNGFIPTQKLISFT